MSIKASELRIGNLINGIYHDYDDGIDEDIQNETICEVVTLDVSGSGDYPIYVYSDENIEHFSDFEPIPLTEEWLLKFGFTNEDDYLELQIHESLSIIYVGYLALMIDGVIIQVNNTNSGKVHQLQNLYFALKGEEIKQQEQ
jgi:hypothetical protein